MRELGVGEKGVKSWGEQLSKAEEEKTGAREEGVAAAEEERGPAARARGAVEQSWEVAVRARTSA